MNPAAPPSSPETQAAQLIRWFGDQQYVIALSGGVDSAVVCQAAVFSGKNCLAVTADSPSVARRELNDALQLVSITGVAHRILHTDEISDPAYQQNDRRRCYHCKAHLFDSIRSLYPEATIVTGTNGDDLSDYRPGLDAARKASVRSPLAELEMTKSQVRQVARLWKLPLADKPASPCLASRLAYGVSVTPERLSMVERAETLLREMGFQECRVRLHADDLARIEVPQSELARLVMPELRQKLTSQLERVGFRFVTLDLAGFRSGSLNAVLHQISR